MTGVQPLNALPDDRVAAVCPSQQGRYRTRSVFVVAGLLEGKSGQADWIGNTRSRVCEQMHRSVHREYCRSDVVEPRISRGIAQGRDYTMTEQNDFDSTTSSAGEVEVANETRGLPGVRYWLARLGRFQRSSSPRQPRLLRPH